VGSRLEHIRRYVQENGLRHTAFQAWQKTRDYYLRSYDRWFDKNKPTKEELDRQHQHIFKKPPMISVAVPVFNTRADYLKEMAMSVVHQSYPHWELCLLDGGSSKQETLDMLKELAGTDKRIRTQRAVENLGIAGNTNLAIDMARGSYVALLDHDDTLTPDALYWVADAIERTGAEVLYSDEDKMHHEGKYLFTPHLKPDYSPDLLKSCNYFCHLMVIQRELLKNIGGLMTGFDGSQDHELALRATHSAKRVCHIPKVLYHWRQDANSMSHRNMDKCLDAGRRAAQAQIEREGLRAHISQVRTRNRIVYEVEGEPLVTLILYTDEDGAKAEKLEKGILEKAGYEHLEILKVNGKDRCRVLNTAAQQAKGDYILFMDGGVKVDTLGWVRQWVGYCQRESCLSVCAKMVDKRNNVAFAGYAVGVGKGVTVPQKGAPGDSWGYFGIKEMTHNVAAASWSLMMVKKELFLKMGGFDEDLPALADVDWCLRASRDNAGWHTYDPYLKAVTDGRGLWQHYSADWEEFLYRWSDLQDPYYNPQWSRKDANYRLK